MATTLYQDGLVLACLAEQALAGRKEVRWTELAGEPLALLRHGSGLRPLVERGFAAAGEPLVPAFQVAHVNTAVGLVEAGLAVAVLPCYALSRAPPSSAASTNVCMARKASAARTSTCTGSPPWWPTCTRS